MKAFMREDIVEGFGQGLLLGRAAAQPVAADWVVVEIDLGPHQAMDPLRVHQPAPAQDPDGSRRLGAAQIDHQPARPALELQPPVFREGPAAGRSLGAAGPALLVSRHEAVAGPLKGADAGMMKTLPDLLLPEVVEALVEVLRPGFARRRKDGRDPEAEAPADDLAQHIGMRVRPLETGVVVERGLAGQAVRPPVRFQPLTEPARREGRADPGPADRSPQGAGGEPIQARPGLQRQILDDIESIEFGPPRGHGRQRPARRRGELAHAAHAVEQTVAAENAADGAPAGRRRFGSADRQRFTDGLRADEAQRAPPELLAQGHDAALDGGGRLPGLLPWSAGSIRPIDLPQRTLARPGQPALHGAERLFETSCAGVLRQTTAHGRHHRPPFFQEEFFMATSLLPDAHVMTLAR